MSASEMDDIIKDFLMESYENLDTLDRDFIALEENPTDKDKLGSIFRTIHSIKGTCGFLGFSKLEKVAHTGENLLSKLRDGQMALSPQITSALLNLVDAVRQILGHIENEHQEGGEDFTPLIQKLTVLYSGVAVEIPSVKPIGEILVEGGKIQPEQLAVAIQAQQDGDPRHVGEILIEKGSVESGAVKEALQEQKTAQGKVTSISESTLRVEVNLLDKLMNRVGELVLSRNELNALSALSQNPALVAATQRLNHITSELQEGLMKTRMQPISSVWGKFPRVVRDLSQALGKNIRLEMEGQETELDKSLLEAIKDPLTHMVRNSVDHGIEMPEKRLAGGKPSEGKLSLRAFHEGGQVIIEIIDDGGGISAEKIKSKALEKGLISADQAHNMSEKEALDLIFLPGFSTAEKVTNVSGRGVGMDVVRTNIEKISGSVEIQSKMGQGSTFKIKIPLTLAIIPALLIKCRAQSFSIPQVNLLELIRVEGEKIKQSIEYIDGSSVYRLRGNLLPLIHLEEALQLGIPEKNPETIHIVVLQADEHQFGLVVDKILDSQEIVVKPLDKHLADLEVYAGATILGTGKVSLILDVMGVARKSNIFSSARGRPSLEKKENKDIHSDLQSLLVFRSKDDGRIAVPLENVIRLEELPANTIEHSGDQDVIQYRESILPLFFVEKLLPERRKRERDKAELTGDIPVIIYRLAGNRSIGLVVGQIVDIVETALEVKQPPAREGVLFSSIIEGRVTEMLDVDYLAKKKDPHFFERQIKLSNEDKV